MSTQIPPVSEPSGIPTFVPAARVDKFCSPPSETAAIGRDTCGPFDRPTVQQRVCCEFFSASAPFFVVDVISFGLSLMLVATATNYYCGGVEDLLRHGVTSAIALVVMLFAYRLYPGIGMNPIYEFRQSLMAVGATFVLVASAALTGGSSTAVLLMFPILVILLPFLRSMARRVMAQYEWWGVKCLVFSAERRVGRLFKEHLRNTPSGLRPVGYIQDQAQTDSEEIRPFYLGDLKTVNQRVEETGCQVAIVHRCGRPDHEIAEFVDRHLGAFSKVVIVPDDDRLPSLWSMGRDGGTVITDRLQIRSNQIFKRAMDILFSSAGLIFGAPVFIGIAVWVKITSPGPLFFGHERIGKNGRRFSAWKFRSMCVNADEVLKKTLDENPDMRKEWEATQKLQNDPRVSSCGQFLRKTSLDELPQLWNVLVGDMSLVGPRPIVASEIKKYKDSFAKYLRVRPGVTGFWQISGRNLTTYNKRVELDEYYVRNWSPWFDMYILIRTVRTVLFREGAF